jgi:hypothetical protein
MLERQLILAAIVIVIICIGFWLVKEVIKLKTQDKFLFVFFVSILSLTVIALASLALSYFVKNNSASSVLKIYVPYTAGFAIAVSYIFTIIRNLFIKKNKQSLVDISRVRNLMGISFFLIMFAFIIVFVLSTSL